MVGSSFSPSYWMYLGYRFCIGITCGGTLVVGTVVVLEVVGPQYRDFAGGLANFPDGIAEALLCVFAYFSPTWKMYLFSLSMASSAMILISAYFLPETPRWLMANGRLEDLKKLMMSAAKCNGIDASMAEENINRTIASAPQRAKAAVQYGDLFRTWELAKTTTAMVFLWAVIGFSYYGINQYVSFLGWNVYTTVAALGLIQVPACLFTLFVNKRFGRRVSTVVTMAATGVFMLVLVFTPSGHWLITVLGTLGMFTSTMLFNIIYVYTSETYPTEIRNMAFGIGNVGSKFGAFVAPFVAILRPRWLPSLVFAISPLLAAGVCFFLAETKGRKSEDHLERD